MSSPPPSPTLPLPTTTTTPMATTAGAPHMPVPVTSAAPVPTVFTPEEVTGALHDLATAVQGIHLYLAGHYGPPPVAPPAAATGPLLLPWQPPHLAASAAVAGLPWQPPLLAASAAPIGPLQQQLTLQPPTATTPPWSPWPS